MQVIERDSRFFTAVPQPRVIRAIVLHNTVTRTAVECRPNGSWHWQILRSGGLVWLHVPEHQAAWHVRAADRWAPPWLWGVPPHRGLSTVNLVTVGVELVSDAGRADGVPPLDPPYTDAQYAALSELLADLYARHGGVPVVGHGELQADRTDPVDFDWERAGFGPRESDGRWWLGTGGTETVTEEDRAALAVLRQYGWGADSIVSAIEQLGALQAALDARDARIAEAIKLGHQLTEPAAELQRTRLGSGQRRVHGRTVAAVAAQLVGWGEGG